MRTLLVVLGLVGAIGGCGRERRVPTADDTPSSAPQSTAVALTTATTATTTAAAASAPATPTKEPLGDVTIGRVTVEGKVAEADLVVGSFKAEFSDCYERALAESPTTGGRVDLVVKVEPTGSIVGMPTEERAVGLAPDLTRCLSKTLGSARFRGFTGSRATIRVPLVLAPKKR